MTVHRPLHATVAGALALIWAAYSLLFGALFSTGLLELPGPKFTPPNMDPTTFRTLTGIMVMLPVALWVPIGIGLLRLKKWARTVALVMVIIGLVTSIPYLVILRTTLGVGWFLTQVVWLITQGIMLWLLVQPSVREAFGVLSQPQAETLEVHERPPGVKFLAVLCVLAALGSLVFGVVYAVALPFLDANSKADTEAVRVMRAVLIVGILPWAAAYVVCALGLWRLRNWGRILAIIFAVFWLFPALSVAAIGILAGMDSPSLSGILIMLIMALLLGSIPALTLWYLFHPRVKQLFAGRPAATVSPSSNTP